MKNRGFTLVELLAVIAILALLALASFEALDVVNKGNKQKAEAVQINSILTSAVAYAPTSDVKLPEQAAHSVNALSGGYDSYIVENGKPVKRLSGVTIEQVCISLDYLHFEGIIEDSIVSPMTGKPYDNALVCIVLVNSSTKRSIENELENAGFTWIYDGSYLYYFNTGNAT